MKNSIRQKSKICFIRNSRWSKCRRESKLFVLLKKLSKEQAKAIIDMAESRRRYLGQMDLNIKSPLVWEFYEETLKNLLIMVREL